MGTELNIQQALKQVNTAFQLLAADVQTAGNEGAFRAYTQTITSGGELKLQILHLANLPVMRKWTGARRAKFMRAYTQTIGYDDYEATLPLKLNLVTSDPLGIVSSVLPEFMKQLGAFDASMSAAYDANSGAGPTGFDGVALFATTHPHSSTGSTQSNLDATTNLSHANLVAAEYNGMLITQENGEPAMIRYDQMRVGPKLKRRAMELVGTSQRVVPIAATGEEAYSSALAAATRESTYKGDYVLLVDDRVSTFYWDLIDTSKGQLRPMVQFLITPPTAVIRDQPTDPRVWENREALYGITGQRGIGAGHWYTCRRATRTA